MNGFVFGVPVSMENKFTTLVVWNFCDPKDSACGPSLIRELLPSHLFSGLLGWLQSQILVQSVCLRVIPPVLRDVILLTTPAHTHPPTQTSPTLLTLFQPLTPGVKGIFCVPAATFSSMKAQRENEKERANPTSVVTTVRGG